MNHVVFLSGGLSSFCAAKRVIAENGKDKTILLFTDTKMEDEDLYRFLKDSEFYFDIRITWLADGRNPWDVYRDTKFLGNSRTAPCSRVLKQEVARKYVFSNFKTGEAVLYLGIGWDEDHRVKAPVKHWAPFEVRFPLLAKPYLSRQDMINIVEESGIEVPRLYKMGFSHNNCGGFCCRAGQGHFANLLKQMPERFDNAVKKEEEMRQFLGKNVAIMKKKGEPYTLAQLKTDIGNSPKQIDLLDIGGCGCFVDE